MNKEEYDIHLKKAAELFAKEHKLAITPQLYSEALAAFWVQYGLSVVRQDLDLRSTFQSHGHAPLFVFIALERAFNHAEACVVALVTGSFATAEAIARVTVEAAVNVRYILKADPFKRLVDYFSEYIDSERSKVKNWQSAIKKMNEDERQLILPIIQEKLGALDGFQTKLNQVKAQINPPVNGQPDVYQPKPWPNIFQRFQEVGDEHAYRTVYSALSSQIHNGAEDLLNRFILEFHKDENLLPKQTEINEYYARMATYNAIAMVLEAAGKFAQYLDLQSADQVLANGENEMQDASSVIAIHLESLKPIQTGVPSS